MADAEADRQTAAATTLLVTLHQGLDEPLVRFDLLGQTNIDGLWCPWGSLQGDGRP